MSSISSICAKSPIHCYLHDKWDCPDFMCMPYSIFLRPTFVYFIKHLEKQGLETESSRMKVSALNICVYGRSEALKKQKQSLMPVIARLMRDSFRRTYLSTKSYIARAAWVRVIVCETPCTRLKCDLNALAFLAFTFSLLCLFPA